MNSVQLEFSKGRYRVRLASSRADLLAAQRLRHLAFSPGADQFARDKDAHDPLFHHVLVEELVGARLVGCFRLMAMKSGADIGRSYSAQFYDLVGLSKFSGPMLEIGRLCVHPELNDPDVLRLVWRAIAQLVRDFDIEMLFGCSSFAGTQAEIYKETFGVLHRRYMAPARWRPGVKSSDVVRFGSRPSAGRDIGRGLIAMPGLLRSYLDMGGWVSDHAVVDRELGRLHVFTGVEINAIPPARARLLRALAA